MSEQPPRLGDEADDLGELVAGETSAERVTRRRIVVSGITAIGAAVVWSAPFPFSGAGVGQSIESANAQTSPTGAAEPPPQPAQPSLPIRAAYCSVAGNTFPDGTVIKPGTFLDLQFGQPSTDPNYKGAVPAIFVEGKGLTCDPPPAGFVQSGLYPGPNVVGNFYPYWKKP